MIKDVSDAVSERIKAPLYGYVILAFVAINWKGFFFLIMTTGAPEIRWAAFSSHTSFRSLYVWPIFVGMALTLISPWTRYLFDWTSNFPLARSRYMEIENKIIDGEKKLELEEIRDKGREIKERAIIDKAKRDHEIESSDFSDSEKNKLINEIRDLRKETNSKDNFDHYKFVNSLSRLGGNPDDLKVLILLKSGEFTVNNEREYLKHIKTGIMPKSTPQYSKSFNGLNYGKILDSLERLRLAQLSETLKKSPNVYSYLISTNGSKMAGYLESGETEYQELELILKSN